MWHDHDIDFTKWLHPAVWHEALGTWQWIHQVAAPCNVTRSSGIMTLHSPGGSTLQCGRWLSDDMPLNSPKRPPCWNSTSSFDFDHITAVDRSFCNTDVDVLVRYRLWRGAAWTGHSVTLQTVAWRGLDTQSRYRLWRGVDWTLSLLLHVTVRRRH